MFIQLASATHRRDSMLLLFETAAGFALFKVLKEGKLEQAEVNGDLGACRLTCEGRTSCHDHRKHHPQDLYKDFETLDGAQKVWRRVSLWAVHVGGDGGLEFRHAAMQAM